MSEKKQPKKQQPKLSNKQLIIIIVAIIAVFVVAGIIIAKVAGNKTAEPVIEVVDENGEPLTGDVRSYLTGEVLDASIARVRPISVMIENTPEALPSSGLTDAGVIYEAPVEGSLTRLMGIWEDYADVERIGNIRSCRPYYIYFSNEFNTVYYHYGQSIHGEVLLNEGIIDDVNGLDGSVSNVAYFRASDRKQPHDVYTTPEKIAKSIEKKGYKMTYDKSYKGHFTFAGDDDPVTLDNGKDCAVMKAYYFTNHPWFEYNEEDGLYYRYEYKKAQVDANNDKQIAVKNVIFQECFYGMYEETQYLNICLVGSGRGKYFTNGKMIDITWSKPTANDITKYYDKKGNEITLNQGQTWISIQQAEFTDKNEYYATVDEFKNAK